MSKYDIGAQQDPFAAFMDIDAMRTEFGYRYAQDGYSEHSVIGCEILDTRHKTYLNAASHHKSTLSICYQLVLKHSLTGTTGSQIVYCKAFLGGRGAVEYAELVRTPAVSPYFGPARAHWPDLDLILWGFPNDPGLPHLPELIVPGRVAQHIPYDRLPQEFRDITDAPDLAVEVVNYRPETRCTIRYRLRWGPAAAPRELSVYAKTFRDRAGVEIGDRMEYFWSAAKQSAMEVAEPLGYSDATKTVWQRGVSGIPLREAIHQDNCDHYMDAVAHGLAALHVSGIATPVTITADTHLDELKKKTAKLAQAFPDLREHFASLLTHLQSSRPAPGPQCLIHGDFHIRQLLAHQGKVVFFDFDELAIGDPTQDLANFMVDAHFHDLEPVLVRNMATALLHAYGRHAKQAVTKERIVWHARVQFLNKVYRFFLQKKPRLEEQLPWILSQSERFCSWMRDTPILAKSLSAKSVAVSLGGAQ